MAGPDEARAATEAIARRSYGKLVAMLAARSRDVAGAEDALAEAFASALATWPARGVPHNPEGWLLTAARRRSVDTGRRRSTQAAGEDHLKLIAEEREAAMGDETFPDERLGLMFACAHPAIEPAVRAPLMLQAVLGFDAAAIGSAFLVAPATMGQRLVRAKARIKEQALPFRIPDRHELGERLDAVLSAIYAAFGEGWTDATGAESRRRNLAGEAIWLGRLMVSLAPGEPETHGLLALMLFAEARRPARRDKAGAYVPLGEQDISCWDGRLIDEAEQLLRQASDFGPTGRYQLEAAVQSVHCARRVTGQTDWAALKSIYDILRGMSASPVVAINRAVAISETDGARAALSELDRLAGDKRLEAYQPYWASRAEMLVRLGRCDEAVTSYDRAIGLESDQAVRAFLLARRDVALSRATASPKVMH